MKILTNKSWNRRPKFLLYININELFNIPQSTGHCFVKWHLKDGTGMSPLYIVNENDCSSSTPDENGTIAITKTTNYSKGTTPKVCVTNRRACWHYAPSSPIRIRLSIDKERKLISKLLIMEVYFEFLENTCECNDSIHLSNCLINKVTGKLMLGSVTINLVEYINQDQVAITDKFLLQKSKVNSILSLTIKMELLRGSFDDFLIPTKLGSLPYSVPNIMEDQMDNNSFQIHNNSIENGFINKHSIAIINPLIERLYQKTFRLPWDPRPGEFTPKECIEDIMKGGDGWAKNEKGICLFDSEIYQYNAFQNITQKF